MVDGLHSACITDATMADGFNLRISGSRLRVEYPTWPDFHVAATKNQVPGTLTVPDQGVDLSGYKVRPARRERGVASHRAAKRK